MTFTTDRSVKVAHDKDLVGPEGEPLGTPQTLDLLAFSGRIEALCHTAGVTRNSRHACFASALSLSEK